MLSELHAGPFRKNILPGGLDGYFTVNDPLNKAPVEDLLDRLVLRIRDTESPPTQPILLVISTADEVISAEQPDAVTANWAEYGCTVEMLRTELTDDVVICFTTFTFTLQWLKDRTGGAPLKAQPLKTLVHDACKDKRLVGLDEQQSYGRSEYPRLTAFQP